MVKTPNIKYPNTQALVGHAIHQGWTQKRIAEVCKVQQSVVSDWNTGKKEARRGAIAPLLKEYGDVVNSSDFRVYNVFDEIKYQVNDDVINHIKEYVTRLKKESKKEDSSQDLYYKKFPNEKRDNFFTWLRNQRIENIESLIQCFETNRFVTYLKEEDFLKLLEPIDDLPTHESFFNFDWLRRELIAKSVSCKSEIVQVEGPVIFEYKFQFTGEDDSPMWAKKENLTTWMKWIVHDNGEGKFTWIVQRDRYKNTNLVTEVSESEERWISTIEEPNDIEAILQRARCYPFTEDEKKLINKDGVIFMLTKAFVERGYPVQGIRIIQAKKG